jgi:ABC-type sugar transport system ATPase subunit
VIGAQIRLLHVKCALIEIQRLLIVTSLRRHLAQASQQIDDVAALAAGIGLSRDQRPASINLRRREIVGLPGLLELALEEWQLLGIRPRQRRRQQQQCAAEQSGAPRRSSAASGGQ